MRFFRHHDVDEDEFDLDSPESDDFGPEQPEDYSFFPYELEEPEDEGGEGVDVFGVPRRSFRLGPILAGAAALCITAGGLGVLSLQAPELYSQLTAPILTGFSRMGELGRSALDGASLAAAELAQAEGEPEELPEESQQLDDSATAPPPRPRAPFEVTSLIERDGQEILTGGAHEIIYYNQTYDRWADAPYGTDRLGGYGCGPTAMAMAVSSLTSTAIDPAEMAQWCVENRYWARKHGSYLSIVSGAAEAYGLTCTPLSPEELDPDLLVSYLATGQVIAALMGPGHFTSRGHFILLRGVTLDGSILVADPASVERSLTPWDLDLILEELSASRHHGAPLWVLSQSGF